MTEVKKKLSGNRNILDEILEVVQGLKECRINNDQLDNNVALLELPIADPEEIDVIMGDDEKREAMRQIIRSGVGGVVKAGFNRKIFEFIFKGDVYHRLFLGEIGGFVKYLIA